VTDEIPATHDLDDAKLLNLVRAGDGAAFAALYQRHEHAARRLARDLVVSPAEVDDVVAETFNRVLDVAMRGGGPTDGFRPYLLTAVRRVCHDRLQGQRRQVPADQQWMADPGQPYFDTAATGMDRSLMTRAFLSLPERWSAALWHTEIERSSAAEVAPIFGLTRNGVAALRRRAREGLRQAYLQMYISRATRPECKPVAARLGGFVRDSLPKRDTTMVSEHLSECGECQAVCAELSDINGALRNVVAPIFLGSASASYLATAVDDPSVAAGTAIAGGTVVAASAGATAASAEGVADAAGAIGVGGFHGVISASGSGGAREGGADTASSAAAGAGTGNAPGGAAPTPALSAGGAGYDSGAGFDSGAEYGGGSGRSRGATGMAGLRRSSSLVQWLAGAAAAVVAVFAVAFAVTLTGNHTPTGPGHHPQAGPTPLPLTLSTPGQTQPSKSAKTRAAHTPSTSPSQAPSSAGSSSAGTNPVPAVSSPAPSPTPSKSAQLAASVGIYNGGYFGNLAQVAFQVSDTGSGTTSQLTVTITLPAGSSMVDGRRNDHTASDRADGWSCQPSSTGATCQHAAIKAGSQAPGAIFIMVSSSSACGQPVQLSATDGSVSASAQSPGGIPCSQGSDG
jgi:RNA polymerase sigma factor (sigma-70 family)